MQERNPPFHPEGGFGGLSPGLLLSGIPDEDSACPGIDQAQFLTVVHNDKMRCGRTGAPGNWKYHRQISTAIGIDQITTTKATPVRDNHAVQTESGFLRN